MSDFKSIGELLRGDPGYEGLHWESIQGWSVTAKPTSDPRYPGGHFVSHTNALGAKATAVWDASGQLVTPPKYGK